LLTAAGTVEHSHSWRYAHGTGLDVCGSAGQVGMYQLEAGRRDRRRGTAWITDVTVMVRPLPAERWSALQRR